MLEVLEVGSFEEMVRLRGGKEIGGKIHKFIGCLTEANDPKSVIDEADYNDEEWLSGGSLGNSALTVSISKLPLPGCQERRSRRSLLILGKGLDELRPAMHLRR